MSAFFKRRDHFWTLGVMRVPDKNVPLHISNFFVFWDTLVLIWFDKHNAQFPTQQATLRYGYVWFTYEIENAT